MHRGWDRPALARRAASVLGALALVSACSSGAADTEVAGRQLDPTTQAPGETTVPDSGPEERTSPPSTTPPTSADEPPTAGRTGADGSSGTEADLVHPDAPPELADSPEGLAAQIVDAERTARDDSATVQETADAAHVLQAAYRHLSHRPDWDRPVADRVPEDLHLSLMANVAARREFLGMYRTERENLPAWRIVAPPSRDELLGHYRAAEAAHGVRWEYLAAIHLVETAMGRVDGVSSAGALGPMQFMPATWDAFGEGDVRDPADAIMAAARYLAHNGAPADMDAALFNYNRHRNYVRAVRHYASVMIDDPSAHRGFHHWQVYVQTTAGDVLLPVGYDEPEPVPAAEYLARR